MKSVAGVLIILLAVITGSAVAEVTTVLVANPDGTMARIFYSEGKEVARIVRDREGKVTQTTGKVPDGTVKEYLDNGALQYEWNYKNGKLEGISKEFFMSGELLEDMLYKNNVRDGISRKYYKDGKLLGERTFKNNELEGVTRMYFENGKVFAELNYKNGIIDGENRMYFEDGKIRVIETYSNGEKTKMKAFDPEGSVVVDHDFTAENAGADALPVQPKEGKAAEKPITTIPPAPPEGKAAEKPMTTVPPMPPEGKAAEKPPAQ